MITHPSYFQWLKNQARRTAYKFRVSADDLLQDFFVQTLEGGSAKFEWVWSDTIRREFQRGITGKRDPAQFATANFSLDDEVLRRVRSNQKKMSDTEFIEYMIDLRTMLTEPEFKVVWLAIIGFGKSEIFEQSQDLTRRELEALWKRLGIEGLRTGDERPDRHPLEATP